MGEFIFDLSAINLSIKDNSLEPSPEPHRRHHQPHPNHHRNRVRPHDVTCTIGHIKVKFQGGAARLCQFLTSLYIKVYRRHLEAQISKVIQETVQDDGQILLSALSVMASMHSEVEPLAETPTHSARRSPQNPTHPARRSPQNIVHDSAHRLNRSTSENESGKIQRFLDSFTRHTPQT